MCFYSLAVCVHSMGDVEFNFDCDLCGSTNTYTRLDGHRVCRRCGNVSEIKSKED